MNSSMHCRSHILLREFSSEVANIDRFCGDVRRMLAELGLTSQIFPIELLLRESLNNAMLHGNAGDIEKTIEAEVRITRQGDFTARDGPGERVRTPEIREQPARSG